MCSGDGPNDEMPQNGNGNVPSSRAAGGSFTAAELRVCGDVSAQTPASAAKAQET